MIQSTLYNLQKNEIEIKSLSIDYKVRLHQSILCVRQKRKKENTTTAHNERKEKRNEKRELTYEIKCAKAIKHLSPGV